MTKARKAINIITSLIMALFGLGLFRYPGEGLYLIAVILSITITLRGFQILWYYFTMARFMVGGKFTLYRGMLFLDAGILTSSISNYPALILILYIAGLHAFTGFIDILRSRDSRAIGAGSWKFQIFTGLSGIAIAAAVIFAGLFMHSARLAVYVYAAGLIYTAILRIISTFRKTAIVYIQ